MGEPVAGRELPKTASVRREPGADELEAAAQSDQDGAPNDVGPQDQVSEHRVLGDQAAQRFRWDVEHLAGLAYLRAHKGGLAGEEVEFTEEPAPAVHADHPVRAFQDGDQSFQDDEEVAPPVALPVEQGAFLDPPPRSKAGERLDLLFAEAGIGAVHIRRLRQRVGVCGDAHAPAPPGEATGSSAPCLEVAPLSLRPGRGTVVRPPRLPESAVVKCRWSPSRWSPCRWSPCRWSPCRWSPCRWSTCRWPWR